MTAAQGAIMFIILVLGGELLELLLTRLYYWIKRKPYKKYHFSFARYIMFLLFPLLGFLLIIFLYSYQPLKVFLIFAIAGTVLEWAVGFAYNMIVGQKLWTYHRYSITGYTSLLATPVWGLLGILTWLLARATV